MNAKDALDKLGRLEAAHCGDGAEHPIAGFDCLEEVIEALGAAVYLLAEGGSRVQDFQEASRVRPVDPELVSLRAEDLGAWAQDALEATKKTDASA